MYFLTESKTQHRAWDPGRLAGREMMPRGGTIENEEDVKQNTYLVHHPELGEKWKKK